MRRHPRRLGSADYQGYHAYSLTICTHARTRAFVNPEAVHLVLSQFLHTARDEHCEVLAYCFMPDHAHLLLVAHAEQADLPRFVRIAKQRSGFAFLRACGVRLWQGSYFDRTVRGVEELPALVDYMIRNPVRAGLVSAPIEYPYWGSQRYSREELLEFIMFARRG